MLCAIKVFEGTEPNVAAFTDYWFQILCILLKADLNLRFVPSLIILGFFSQKKSSDFQACSSRNQGEVRWEE